MYDKRPFETIVIWMWHVKKVLNIEKLMHKSENLRYYSQLNWRLSSILKTEHKLNYYQDWANKDTHLWEPPTNITRQYRSQRPILTNKLVNLSRGEGGQVNSSWSWGGEEWVNMSWSKVERRPTPTPRGQNHTRVKILPSLLVCTKGRKSRSCNCLSNLSHTLLTCLLALSDLLLRLCWSKKAGNYLKHLKRVISSFSDFRISASRVHGSHPTLYSHLL